MVGAGVIGLACAWRAAQRGLAVLVLDREGPGAGASGVAAGMLAPVTEAEFGEEALLRLNLLSARRWPSFSAELAERSGIDTGYRESGALVVAADRDDAAELRRLHGFQASLGLQVEWLPPSRCRELEPGLSPRVAGGVLAPQDHHVDPAAVVRALTAALATAGGELLGGVHVAGVVVERGTVAGVRTAAGEVIAAGHVLVAAGCWSPALDGLPPEAVPPVRPVKGQILSLRAPARRPPAERLIRTPRSYLVSRGDGRVVIGATVEERGFDTRVTAEGVHRLLEAAWEVLPDVGELELVDARAGLRPATPDNAPVIGAGAVDGLVWASGHHRNGVLLAPLTADAVRELLGGAEPAPELTAADPGRFLDRRARAGSGSPREPAAARGSR